jgi:hypothetical protein
MEADVGNADIIAEIKMDRRDGLNVACIARCTLGAVKIQVQAHLIRRSVRRAANGQRYNPQSRVAFGGWSTA